MPIPLERMEAALARTNELLKGTGVVVTLARTKKDHAEAVEVLFLAFRHYPFNEWIMEGRPEAEADEMVRFAQRWVNRLARTEGYVLVARDESSGNAIGAVQFCEKHQSMNALERGWSEFTKECIQWTSILFGSTGFPSFMFKDARVRQRFSAFDLLSAEHAKVIPFTTRHIHVITLGTNPELQAKGIGKALLDTVAELANDLRVPIFLETNTARLRAYYERNGYEFKAQYTVPDKDRPYTENFALLKPFIAKQETVSLS